MKYSEITKKDTDVLQKELKTLQDKVVELRVKIKLGQAKNVHELSKLRKDIARIHTFLTTQTN